MRCCGARPAQACASIGAAVPQLLTASHARMPQTRRAGEGSRGALLWGAAEPAAPVVFRENGVAFESDVVKGQKTGFFLDQRDNRQRMQVCMV